MNRVIWGCFLACVGWFSANILCTVVYSLIWGVFTGINGDKVPGFCVETVILLFNLATTLFIYYLWVVGLRLPSPNRLEKEGNENAERAARLDQKAA